MRRMMLAAVLSLAPVVALAGQQADPWADGSIAIGTWPKDETLTVPAFPAGQMRALCISGAVCVGTDGSVTMQPDVTPTLAAKRFWNAVAQVRGQKLLFPEIAQ